MESVVQQLELKYSSFLKEREHEDATDSFQPAYEYLVIIETQPKVKEIIKKIFAFYKVDKSSGQNKNRYL